VAQKEPGNRGKESSAEGVSEGKKLKAPVSGGLLKRRAGNSMGIEKGAHKWAVLKGSSTLHNPSFEVGGGVNFARGRLNGAYRKGTALKGAPSRRLKNAKKPERG